MAKPKHFASKLHMAVALRNPGWVKRLLAEGYDPNINTGDEYSHSLVHHAMLNGDGDIAAMLKKAGATAPTIYADSYVTEHWVYTLVGEEVEFRVVPRFDPASMESFEGSLG